jgi:hypothetical protein
MRPEIGDIIDCRNSAIGHFTLCLGVDSWKGLETVMYYKISSRVYAVFPDVVEFFNDCIQKKYPRFYHFFGKEKGKDAIVPHGRICDSFFLDSETDYGGCLEADSIIVINKEPVLIDIEAFKSLHKDRKVAYRSRLIDRDLIRLIEMIKHSDNIGQRMKSVICRNFNECKNMRKRVCTKKSGP